MKLEGACTMNGRFTESDIQIINKICSKVIPGSESMPEKISRLFFGWNKMLVSAWLFYLRSVGPFVIDWSDAKLKRMAYKSPFKDFMLPIRYAAFSDTMRDIELPVNLKIDRWQKNMINPDDESLECEYIIVGSGAGGASIAYKLASMGHAVLILEDGGYFNRKDFTGDPDWAFKNIYRNSGLSMAWSTSPFPVLTGKAVGGTTIINSGTCVRTGDHVFDEWEQNDGVVFKNNLSGYYDEAESHLNVCKVEDRYIGSVGELVKDAATKLGWKHGPLPRNSVGCDGRARCCFGCPSGAKMSTDTSFIPKALGAGAKLIKHCHVYKVDFEGDKAVGVSARIFRKNYKIRAEKGVVLACGSLSTPLLLMNSGVSNRHIGRHLSLHPSIGVFALHGNKINMTSNAVPQSYHVSEFLPDFMLEGASMPEPVAAMAMKSIGEEFSFIMKNYDKLSMFGALMRDSSRGMVLPEGHVYYKMNNHDLKNIGKAIDKLITLLSSSKDIISIYPFVKGLHKISMDSISKYKKNMNKLGNLKQSDIITSAYHPLGSCRMGRGPRTSVVGSDFAVWGKDNLYVVDGSVFPSSTGFNPQLTIMAFGLMAADILNERSQ